MPPPKAKLPDLTPAEVATLKRWIAEGAEYEAHWAFIPLQPERCAGHRRARCARDSRARGLKPQPEADRNTLIRRVSFDLTGLPPTPAEVDAFVNDACARRVRAAGGSAARVAALRRAHGGRLAGYLALRGQLRLPGGSRARGLAVARLGDPRLQRQPAVRQIHHLAARRRPAAEPHRRPDSRDRVQPPAPAGNRGRQRRGGISRGVCVPTACRRSRRRSSGSLSSARAATITSSIRSRRRSTTSSSRSSKTSTKRDSTRSSRRRRPRRRIRSPMPPAKATLGRAAKRMLARRKKSWLHCVKPRARPSPRGLPRARRRWPYLGEIAGFGFESLEKESSPTGWMPTKPATLKGENKLVPGRVGNAVEFTGDDAVDLPIGNFQRIRAVQRLAVAEDAGCERPRRRLPSLDAPGPMRRAAATRC